jgi:hypothetical protein
MIAAIADAASTLNFAADSSVGSGNANDAMKIDMVNAPSPMMVAYERDATLPSKEPSDD